MSQITVLLATYNGSKYVRQMIDSVLAQDYGDFHLVLSDDGSKDDTLQILEEYAGKYPQKVTHYRSGMRFGNAQDHFMHLLDQFHETSYIMFCDQDDYWHPDKMRKTLEKMQQIEKAGLPAMVHTDLRVVDGDLNQMDPSFMHFSKLRGDRLALNQLLVQNVVTGCTMMINKELADLACSRMPKEPILMHDWWLALIASAMGTTGYLDEATIDYRQHGNNVVGAKNTRSVKYIANKLRENKIRTAMEQTYAQAAVFESCFADVLGAESMMVVRAYAGLCHRGFLGRRMAFVKNEFYKIGISRILGQMLFG